MTAAQLLADRQWVVRAYGAALVGGVVWVAALFVLRPNPLDTDWAKALLMLAPLVLLPLGLRLAAPQAVTEKPGRLRQSIAALQLPAAMLLGGAFLLPQGFSAAALAVPWLAITGLIALIGLVRIRQHARGPLHELCMDAGLVYVAVGGAWAVLDRLGVRPLGFEAVIVLLTAIHFHYAGFVLPIVTGFAIREVGGLAACGAGVGVIAGVPVVAAGITATQLNLGSLLECASAWILAWAGVLIGWLHIRLALQPAWPPVVRFLWAVSAVALTLSMVLAALYGSRFYVPVSWLDIRWMRALHGSANALGFGLASLLSWTLAEYHSGIKAGAKVVLLGLAGRSHLGAGG